MSFVEYMTEPEAIASIMAAVAVFALILSLMLPMLQDDRLETRLKQVTAEREKLRRSSRAELSNSSGIRMNNQGRISRITESLDLQKMLEDPIIESLLLQAGLRGPRPLTIFYFCRFTLPLVFGFLVMFIIFLINDFGLSTQLKYGSIVGGAAIGFYLPNLIVGGKAAQRQKSIMSAFPDALDMILICVEAGMSIEMAFSKVGAEIGTASADLAEELQLTTAELAYLQERRMAFENLAKRTAHDGIKSATIALIQAERYGTPLGDALRVMAKENRDLRMQAVEKKAAALPAKLTVPMIVFFLPVLFLVVLGPAYIKITGKSGFDKPGAEASVANTLNDDQTMIRRV